jgi:ubiquinol-cytochrome c reductase cytochrome b subunit
VRRFFLTVYLHMCRALFYGSYTAPRQKVWYTGIIIFLLMIITAFLGYVLPWGQMSYWAATVITSLVSTIPVFGKHILIFLWGGISIDQPTLTRVYGLHFFLPFIIFAFVVIHIYFLHEHGSTNPLGFESLDYAPFHSYFILKDIHGVNIILILFYIFVFFYPNYLGHPDNYIPANPSVTPTHIVPEWYFLPFYGILRSVPNKTGGILLLIFALIVLSCLPLIHKPLLRSSVFRPVYVIFLYFFFAAWILLGWSGSKPIAYPYYEICQFSTLYYFLFFLVLTPFILIFEEICYNSLSSK